MICNRLSANSIRMIVAASIPLLISACGGGSDPTISDARAIYESKWKAQIDAGLIEIDQFEKTNSQSGELLGIRFYEIEYEATIEYPKGWNLQCGGAKARSLKCLRLDFHEVGETSTFTGTYSFEETENGWRGPDGNIY